MGVEVAALYATLGMIDNLTPGLKNANNSLSSFASNLGKQMTDVGKSLTAGVTVPIVAALGFAVKAASDNATTMAKLNQQIKDTGNATGDTTPMIVNLADQLEKLTGVSKNSLLQAETLTASYKQIGKDTFPAATKAALDMSAALNIDLRTATMSLDKALADPIKGLTALRREGIVFTASQQEQIKAMEKANNLLGAQGIILQVVQQKYGGMAAALGNTPQGNLNKLTNAVTDLGVAIGNVLAPVIAPIVADITNFVDGLTKLPKPTLELAVKIALLAAAAGPLLIVVGSLTTAFGALSGVFFPVIVPLLLIGGLIAAYQTNWMGFRDTVNKIGDVLRYVAGVAGQLAFIFAFELARAVHWIDQNMTSWVGTLAKIETQFTGAFTNAIIWVDARLSELGTTIQTIDNAIINLLNDIGKLPSSFGGPGFQFTPGYTTPPSMQGLQGGSNIAASINSQLGLIGGPAQLRDSGGSGQAGRPYLIGTGAQPELFTPSTNGTFTPNGGGGPSTLHVVFQAQNFEEHLYVNIAEAKRRANP